MPTSAARVRHISDLASKMADFLQLDAAALRRIRKSSEDPPRVSVYDLIGCITGHSASNSKTCWDMLVVKEMLTESDAAEEEPCSVQIP